MKNIGIIGFGWLAEKFATNTKIFNIFPTTTSPEKFQKLSQNFSPTLINFSDRLEEVPVWERISELDCIIISLPLRTKNCCVSSVYNKINNVLQFLKGFENQIILLSSTSVYLEMEKVFTESDLEVSSVITEKLFFEKFPQTNILRLGGLMGDDRFLAKYGVKSNLNSRVNHIYFKDATKVLEMLILNNIKSEILNVVAPIHPTKQEVIDYQTTGYMIVSENTIDRIISSGKLIEKYNYKFEFPNPLYFPLF